MRGLVYFVLLLIALQACRDKKLGRSNSIVIGAGKMPNMATDKSHNIHVVFGSNDSILYSYSADMGKTFSAPALISVLPKLAASHMRGPQVAATSQGLVVIACNSVGDIFSYTEDRSGRWKENGRVNDVDSVAREGLMALAADGENAFAVWLDLRDGHNKIFGARSNDGGKSWSKNMLIYASPDTTVCECCKPSVAMKGTDVYVMFRNWLKGNRDLYLTHSANRGDRFDAAQKLGIRSWALNGCPMDGGALTLSAEGNVETVWRRKGKIYACEPGKPETEIGAGKGVTMDFVNGQNVYAWTESGNIVVVMPDDRKEKLGHGSGPIVKAVDDNQVVCVWENDKQVHSAVLNL